MTRTTSSKSVYGKWIRASLIASGLMLVVTAFVLLMQMLLGRLGDEQGAEVAQVAALVTGTVFVIGHVLLVALLALGASDSNME